jgi:glycosyltransferase involved in cell wall biosynthesis
VKVLIDATGLGDDSAYRGIGTYLRHLLEGLGSRGDLEVQALALPAARVPDGVHARRRRALAPGRWRRVEHELRLPLALARMDADVFHSPALDPPARCPAPWVQTLHDVIPLVFEDPELAVERRRWERQAPRYRRAQAIIAISRHTAEVGVTALGLDPERIEVIPHGVSPAFAPAQTEGRDDPPSLLMVGEYSRRKGYPEAFAAIGALAELGYPHRLRVTGRIAPWVAPRLAELVAGAPEPARIELLGFVEDLVGAYQRADALIMTSRYEGFGLPILEAMACGTPVVAFSNSAITDVVGDAGRLVADGDVPALVSALRGVLDDPGLREDLRARGIERARMFSWDRCVSAHAELYRRCGP